MATLDDLPDEVLLGVALFLGIKDICVLGATCQRVHAIATDSCLWRSLFMRHFAHLYACIDSTMVPSPGWLAPETWPPEARFLYARSGAASLMPPPCEPAAGLPAPFGNAFAMGKDWRWMYRVHAVVHDKRLAHGPGRKKVHRTMCAGDYTRGSLIYGVNVARDGTSWEEAYTPWQSDVQWRVECTPGVVSCFVRDFCIREWPATGRREWISYSRHAIDSVDEWAGASKVTIVADACNYRVEPTF
ncbi:F-box domain protein [Pandoravirus inopinatum]|uniref:F-box domain protein n=1 Tax=Pandoravirus inopinatum TaxID=1605721 RepID=A0A0B5JCY2_9VIRU|nr:F-box domain protein [Pandoravirus inopinatum]AJF97537.1 F-box domain protein [Pandoravirus inopinatum]